MINSHNYLNKNIDFLKAINVREYDIKSAGFNILISNNALSEKKIQQLNEMPKSKRNITIGLMMQKDKRLSDIVNEGLYKYRKLFIESNEIDDQNILSIKRDAIYVIQKVASIKKFDSIEFVEKNKYTSYYNIDGLEFYYNRNTLDIKGLGKTVPKIHKDYIIKFLKNLFKLNENTEDHIAIQYLYEFADKYRNLELDPEYYREFNMGSMFRFKTSFLGTRTSIGSKYAPADLNVIDISYNYKKIIVPLIGMLY